MLDNMINMDGLTAGRSLRDRKPVTYTFGRQNIVISLANICFYFLISCHAH